MQTVSKEDSFHELFNPIFWVKNKNINLSSTDLVMGVLKINMKLEVTMITLNILISS